MKTYEYIKKFMVKAKHSIGCIDKHLPRNAVNLEVFLENWSINLHNIHTQRDCLLSDCEEDVKAGMLIRTLHSTRYVSFKITEHGKEYLRFRAIL
jgi:hypothetical protein